MNNIISTEHCSVTSASHLFTSASINPIFTGLEKSRLNVLAMHRSSKYVTLYLGISVGTSERRQMN